MKSFYESIRPRAAFTLIELLVVITIIAIMASMSATVSSRVALSGRIKKATVYANDLLSAWHAYEISFDDWPLPTAPSTQNASDENGDSWTAMEATQGNLAVLLGDNALKIPFLNLDLKEAQNYEHRDPWGIPYRIFYRNPVPAGSVKVEPEATTIAVHFTQRDRYLR